MEKITKQVYENLHAKIEWNKLTNSVLCELYTSKLNTHIREFTELLNNEGIEMPDGYRERVEAQVEAYILLVVDLTELAIKLFLAEGFTEQEQADYYPKEMGDWGEGA